MPIPRHLAAGLVGSSLAHAGAAVLAGVLLQGSFLHFRPPPRGVNSLASAPATLVLEGGWAEDPPAPAPLVAAASARAPEQKPVLEARKVTVTRNGRLPAWTGQASKRSAPESPPAPPAAPPSIPPAADVVAPAIRSPSQDSSPSDSERSRGRRPPTPEIAAAVSSSPSPASAESHGAQTDAPPQKQFSPQPQYPPDALAARLEGRVLLRVRVGRTGRVESVSVLQSSGVRSLDRAALEAVRRWRFEPARRAGAAAAAEVAVPIRFLIEQ